MTEIVAEDTLQRFEKRRRCVGAGAGYMVVGTAEGGLFLVQKKGKKTIREIPDYDGMAHGFAWGFRGQSPRATAVALLRFVTDDPDFARSHKRIFLEEVIVKHPYKIGPAVKPLVLDLTEIAGWVDRHVSTCPGTVGNRQCRTATPAETAAPG